MRIDLHTDPAIVAIVPPRRQARPWLQLVSAMLTLAGEHAQLLSHAETAWASVTFSGTRHAVRLRFGGDQGSEAAEAFITALPEHEFTISRRLVADATIDLVEHRRTPVDEIIIEAVLLLIDAE